MGNLWNPKRKTMDGAKKSQTVFAIICSVFCIVFLAIIVTALLVDRSRTKNDSEKGMHSQVVFQNGWDLYSYEEEQGQKVLYEGDASFPVVAGAADTVMSLVNTIPTIPEQGQWSMYFHTNYQAVEVYVAGVRQDIDGARERLGYGNLPDNPWTAVKLTPEMSGKEIELRLLGHGDKPHHEVYDIFFGTTSDVRWALLLSAMNGPLISIVIGLFMILVLIAVAIIGSRYQVSGMAECFFLSVFIGLCITWFFTDSTLQGALYLHSALLVVANMMSFMLMTVPMALYAAFKLHKGRLGYYLCALLQIVLLLVSILGLAGGWIQLWHVLPLCHIASGISLSYCVGMAFYERFKLRNSISHLYVVAILLLQVCGLLSLRDYYFTAASERTGVYRVGVLFFVVIMVVNLCVRFFRAISAGHSFRALTEMIPAGISRLELDENLTIAYANDYFYQLLGYEADKLPKEFVNRRFVEEPDEYADYYDRIMEHVDRGDKQFEIETRCHNASGESLWMLERFWVDHEAGQLVMTSYDVSERIRMEEQLRISEEQTRLAAAHKTEFLANMSHEIRTPMNVISGMTDLLDTKDLSSLEHEYVSMIKSASSSLLNIINDVLDFTKVDSGKLELVNQEYELNHLLYDLLAVTAPRISVKMLRYLVYVQPGIPKYLYGDEGRLKQILINIINNAAKFTERGEVSLMVSWELTKNNRARISFTVRDTGIGIKAEDMEKLFTQFTRLDTKKNRSIEGTGLGLALSKELAQKMDGDITVQSVYGQGSIFTATVDQNIVRPGAVVDVTTGADYRVLLLEEDEARFQSVRQALQDLGVTVVTADMDEFMQSDKQHAVVLYDYSTYDNMVQADARLKDCYKLAALEYNGQNVVEKPGISFIQKPISVVGLTSFFTADGPVEQKPKRGNAINMSVQNASVVVVDDNNMNLKVASGLMGRYGIKPILMKSGFELLDHINDGYTYDLVFLDHMMPEMDGVETVQKIRANYDAKWREIPIVALTANAIKGVETMFLEAGMTDCLFKPINTPELEAILQKYLPTKCHIEEIEPPKMPTYTGRKEEPEDAEVQKVAEDAIPEAHIDGPDGMPLIPGYHIADALEMVGGDIHEYYELLVEYCSRIEENIQKLCTYLEEHDAKEYTVLVHSLKSSSKLIGNEELAAEAQHLENAGHTQNWDVIASDTETFLNHYEAQQGLLKPLLEQYWKEADKHLIGRMAELQGQEAETIIKRIWESLDDFDDLAAAADTKAMIAMEAFAARKPELEQLLKLIEALDYDGAKQQAQTMMDNETTEETI